MADGGSVPVRRVPWTSDGVRRLTIPDIARHIREAGDDPAMRSLAAHILRQAGFPRSARDRALALHAHIVKHVGYVEDPDMREWVQSPKITLCVEGAPICIPIEDCDGHLCAGGALLRAAGLRVWIHLIEYGGGAQDHVNLVFEASPGERLEFDTTVPGRTIGHVSIARKKTLVDPLSPELVPESEKNGLFVGVGKSFAEALSAAPRDPALHYVVGAGAGLFTTPGDVLSYRAMWNAYVVQTACALYLQAWALREVAAGRAMPTAPDAGRSCANAWIDAVSGPFVDLSIFAAQPPSPATLLAYASASEVLAGNTMTEWNLYAGWSDKDIVGAAGDILQSYQKTVLEVGQVIRPALAQASPALANAIAPGPSEDAQAQLIAGIEGARILAGGVLKVVTTGIGGAIESLHDAAQITVNTLTSPWIVGSVVVVAVAATAAAVAYTVHELRPLLPGALDELKARRQGARS